MKDVRARRGPECATDHCLVKRKAYALCERELRKTKMNFDMEIKIQSPKYKLNLFHDGSIK
jgi:hypothetical protein